MKNITNECVKFFDACLCIKFLPLNASIRLLVLFFFGQRLLVLDLLLTFTRVQWGSIILGPKVIKI